MRVVVMIVQVRTSPHITRSLDQLSASTGFEASVILRHHFSSRTMALITPLAQYINTLLPSPTEIVAGQTVRKLLRLKPFDSAKFFYSLKSCGSTLPFKSTSKRTAFYERWLKTPGFALWFSQQAQIVQGVLEERGHIPQ